MIITGICDDLLYIIKPHHLIEGMVFFISVISLILLFILFYLGRRSRRSKWRRQLREKYSMLISELAIGETEAELLSVVNDQEMKGQLDLWLQDPFARRVLIRELVVTAKSMSGTARENVCWFYSKFGLEQDSLARLKTGKWHVKARAIQELSQLQQKKYITRVYRYTNDRNELVRNEARIAVVKLTGFEGLRFLDVISYPITEWEQLCLLYELGQPDNISMVDMQRWLQSRNSSVIEFVLRLTESYRLYELHDAVVRCLHYPELSIRKKALQALKEISQPVTPGLLAQYLAEETNEELQLAYIQVLETTGSAEETAAVLPFLHHIKNEFRAAAAITIGRIHPQGLQLVKAGVNTQQYPWTVLLPQLEKGVAV